MRAQLAQWRAIHAGELREPASQPARVRTFDRPLTIRRDSHVIGRFVYRPESLHTRCLADAGRVPQEAIAADVALPFAVDHSPDYPTQDAVGVVHEHGHDPAQAHARRRHRRTGRLPAQRMPL
jgi:hypothetical protein